MRLLNFVRAFIVFGLSFLLVSRAEASVEPTPPAAPAAVAEFPIGRWGEIITIPVKWGSKPACFVFDTGATLTVVDPTYFPELRPRRGDVNVGTSGGDRTMRLFAPPDLQVGPVSLRESGDVLCLDMSPFRVSERLPIIGILGMSGIKGLTVQIDYDDHKLRFFRPDGIPRPEWGQGFPLKLDESSDPFVSVSVAGVREDLAIDTGSNEFIDLLKAPFDRLRDVTKQPVISTPALTANGVVEYRELRIRSFEWAGMEYRNVDISEGRNLSKCGLDFLERHLVTLDFRGRRLYLKPGKEFGHFDEKNMAGVRPVRDGEKLVARFVDDKGPAYAAGIRDGDILLELEGKPSDAYGSVDIHELLRSGDGKEIVLKFRRGEMERTVKVKLRRAN